MRCKSCGSTPTRKRKPRPQGEDEHVLTVAEFLDSDPRAATQRTPLIRMRGRWLEKTGFRVGDYIIVKAEPKRLVLTVAHAE